MDTLLTIIRVFGVAAIAFALLLFFLILLSANDENEQ